jgi:hypothetical protein
VSAPSSPGPLAPGPLAPGPLAPGRVEQERLALPHPGRQSVNRLATSQDALDDGSGPAHGRDRLRGQRDRLTVPRHRHDLRNSQITSIEADRHKLIPHL